MDIFFCDTCTARITEDQLRRGQGVRTGDDCVCATCVEAGHAPELVERVRNTGRPLRPAAASPSDVLDAPRDRARTKAEGSTAPTEGKPTSVFQASQLKVSEPRLPSAHASDSQALTPVSGARVLTPAPEPQAKPDPEEDLLPHDAGPVAAENQEAHHQHEPLVVPEKKSPAAKPSTASRIAQSKSTAVFKATDLAIEDSGELAPVPRAQEDQTQRGEDTKPAVQAVSPAPQPAPQPAPEQMPLEDEAEDIAFGDSLDDGADPEPSVYVRRKTQDLQVEDLSSQLPTRVAPAPALPVTDDTASHLVLPAQDELSRPGAERDGIDDLPDLAEEGLNSTMDDADLRAEDLALPPADLLDSAPEDNGVPLLGEDEDAAAIASSATAPYTAEDTARAGAIQKKSRPPEARTTKPGTKSTRGGNKRSSTSGRHTPEKRPTKSEARASAVKGRGASTRTARRAPKMIGPVPAYFVYGILATLALCFGLIVVVPKVLGGKAQVVQSTNINAEVSAQIRKGTEAAQRAAQAKTLADLERDAAIYRAAVDYVNNVYVPEAERAGSSEKAIGQYLEKIGFLKLRTLDRAVRDRRAMLSH